jgi:hypothetical protein
MNVTQKKKRVREIHREKSKKNFNLIEYFDSLLNHSIMTTVSKIEDISNRKFILNLE